MKKILICMIVLCGLAAGAYAAKLEIGKNGEPILDGKPKVLIAVWVEPVPYMDYFINLGIEVFWTGGNPGGAGSDGLTIVDYVNEVKKRNAYAMIGIEEAQKKGEFEELKKNPALIAWSLPDEVDCAIVGKDGKITKNPKYTPEETKKQYDDARKADPTRPTILNFGSEFAFGKPPHRMAKYKEWVKNCDILSVTNYPFDYSGPDSGYLIAKGISQMKKALDGRKAPMCTHIYVGQNDYPASDAPKRAALPYELRAEVWMALINGGTMISYYPHKHIPDYKQKNIMPPIEAEMKRVNKNIKALNDVIFSADYSKKVTIEEKEGALYGMMTKEKDGNGYIFIVNQKNKDQGKVKIAVEGLAAGTEVEVYDEGRKIISTAGGFQDEFKKYDTHIYVVKK